MAVNISEPAARQSEIVALLLFLKTIMPALPEELMGLTLEETIHSLTMAPPLFSKQMPAIFLPLGVACEMVKLPWMVP